MVFCHISSNLSNVWRSVIAVFLYHMVQSTLFQCLKNNKFSEKLESVFSLFFENCSAALFLASIGSLKKLIDVRIMGVFSLPLAQS